MNINLVKFGLSVAALLILGAQASALPSSPDRLVVASVQGDVQVCDKANNCAAVEVGRVLSGGEVLRTGAGGRAYLRFGDKDKFEIRERTRVIVDQVLPRSSRLQLFLGTLKATVSGGWFRRRDVAVVTPGGVMSVRGTEFTVNTNEAGDTVVEVMYGRVDLVDPLSGRTLDNFIQGESGKVQGDAPNLDQAGGAPSGEPKSEELEPMEGEEGHEEFQQQEEEARGDQGAGRSRNRGDGKVEKGGLSADGFVEAFGGAQGFQAFGEARAEIDKKAGDFAGREAAQVANIVTTVREDGFASGRTLRDVHGNLVRVEQLLQRPSGDSIQFVNLVKRDEYTYKGYFPPSTPYPTSSRKDFFKASITFNKTLPENIMEWPSFFGSNSETLRINLVEATMANNTDATSQDFIKFKATYNPGKDEVGGVLCGAGLTFGVNCFEQTTIGFVNGADTGEWVVTDCTNTTCINESANITQDGSGPGDLWSTAELPLNLVNEVSDTLFLVAPDGSNLTAELWLLTESYAIGNGGNILNINNILNSNITEPFAFMRTVAGETILTVRTKPSAQAGQTIFQRGNIDLVIIPDLMVDIVQKYAAHIGDSF
ncbi:MAG: FecR domain-containing protein [Elusimicrobia bacterium]|nr:FecR domain-containing protein [Elusimicrobiota bacterium]